MKLRVGTFNVENLFDRAKVLNLKDHSIGDQGLDDIAKLQDELRKKTYDKAEILRLYRSVSKYIEIREDRGKLFKRSGFKITGVRAKGCDDWDGSIEFKRSRFREMARENTARVVKDVRADIMCLVEVENRPSLAAFNSNLLNRRFKCPMVIDGNDPRGIDVGLLSRHPIGGAWTHIFDKKGNGRPVFSRDCLEVEVRLPDGTPVWVLLNHFKSRGYGDQAENDAKRRAQADRVAEILDQDYDLESDYVVVAGDLNDSPDREPRVLDSMLSFKHLHDVLELQFPHAPEKRWTYHYRSKEQIDYLLVSKPLADRLKKAGVERRGIHDLDKISGGAESAYDTVTHWSNAASDHGAVWAEFEV